MNKYSPTVPKLDDNNQMSSGEWMRPTRWVWKGLLAVTLEIVLEKFSISSLYLQSWSVLKAG